MIKKELKNLQTQAHVLNHADLVEARMIVFDQLITEMRLVTEMVPKSSDMHFKELSIFLLEEQQAFLRSQLKK